MGTTDILKGKKILAVDDEPDVLEIIQERLEKVKLRQLRLMNRLQICYPGIL